MRGSIPKSVIHQKSYTLILTLFFFFINNLSATFNFHNGGGSSTGSGRVGSPEMDPPIVNESSFSTANPFSYTLAAIWPLGLRLANLDGSMEESTVTELSGGGGGGGGWKRKDVSSQDDESSRMLSTTTPNELSNSNGKRMKAMEYKDENGGIKAEVEPCSADGQTLAEQSPKPSEPPKDYIHVRARRGQATDSHSLAERARREKISERMKMLQDLVPGCNKVIGKALVLDEIINYIESLQRQVEFLSMKLEAVSARMNISHVIEGFTLNNIVNQPYDAAGMSYGSQAAREYSQGAQPEWLHRQIGGSFERRS